MEQKFLMTQKEIDEVANKYNKTKDPKYKDLWYKLIKDNYGTDYFKRRVISINSVVQADDGTCVFIGRSRLHGPVQNIKTKINRIC